MSNTLVITQSNYIPWKGYFDLIRAADIFVIYDEVQYTKNDWRNRNQIKTVNGAQWLTIPVYQKSLDQRIDETETSQKNWNVKHWKTIQANYAKAPFFKEVSEELEKLYLSDQPDLLSEINLRFINFIVNYLEIDSQIIQSTELNLKGDRNERLIDACEKLNSNRYISGPAAKEYLDRSMFEKAGIEVVWADYSGYPVYPQLHGEFDPHVSILDLIFNLGKDTTRYMKNLLGK